MRDLALSEAHRAFSIRPLALHAQRVGAVFASPTTWMRLIRARGWRRPTRRVHPARAKVGVRATIPNQIWHIDVSFVRLIAGTKVFVQAVLDNFSRKRLAHRVSPRIDPAATADLLRPGADRPLPKSLVERESTDLLCDSGIENINRQVDAALPDLGLRRVLAQVDIEFSTSLTPALSDDAEERNPMRFQ